jgi:hypothetical protein
MRKPRLDGPGDGATSFLPGGGVSWSGGYRRPFGSGGINHPSAPVVSGALCGDVDLDLGRAAAIVGEARIPADPTDLHPLATIISYPQAHYTN